MMTVVSTFHYNRTLTAKTMLGSISLLYWMLHSLLHLKLIIPVTACSKSITIPKECCNEPNEKHKWDYYGHDHVPDLIAQVHKHTNNIVSLCQGEDTYHAFEH